MQKFLILLYAVLVSFNLSAEHGQSRINWITNYEEALNQSNANSKPILLLFTASDYCPWCVKLDSEVFQTEEFANAAADKFIFVMLDNPSNGKLPANLLAQNQQLKKQYRVKGFPTVILINGKGQKIGETGYKQGGGKQYAEHLLKMVGEFSNYQQKISSLDKQNFSGQELKLFYEKAQEFGLLKDMNKIMAAGIKSDQKQFFLLERYRFLANEGQFESKEAISLKKQLLGNDPKNENLTHYHVAIIDFETVATMSNNKKQSADFFIAPLSNYIERFGKQDKSNLWRLHMIISQVYYDKDQKEKALQHAELSLISAPPLVQSEIQIVIKNMREHFPSSIANSN